jgi:hypothetical protein
MSAQLVNVGLLAGHQLASVVHTTPFFLRSGPGVRLVCCAKRKPCHARFAPSEFGRFHDTYRHVGCNRALGERDGDYASGEIRLRLRWIKIPDHSSIAKFPQEIRRSH